MPSFIAELKKRKVFNSAAIYLATAFIILQAAGIIIPALLIPDWVLRLLVVLAILGFPVVIVLSWIYDISDEGLVKTIQFENPKYVGDPINAVRIFNEKLVDELMVLDIDATVENREPDFITAYH